MSNQQINHSNSVSKQMQQDTPLIEHTVTSNNSQMVTSNYRRGFMGSRVLLGNMQGLQSIYWPFGQVGF